jgi:Mrp family chromosome partitioning ATPase/capsular polysaccharide biosynthesis protein
MLTWHDVGSYARLLRRWWAVIALSTGLALGTAWYFTQDEEPIYIAQSTVMVGDTFLSTNPDPFQMEVASALAQFYSQLVRRQVILEPVVEQLQLELPWQALQGMVSTGVNERANLLEITVIDTNAERSAAIANAVVDQLVAYGPNAPEKIAEQQELLAKQAQETQALINDVEAKIAEQKRRIAELTSAVDLRDAQNQLDELEAARERYQDSFNQLVFLQGNSTASALLVFERAEVPGGALPDKQILTIAVAGLGGFLLSVLAILLIDWLDESWRGRRDVRERLGMVDLGYIPQGPPVVMSRNSASAATREQAVREAHTRLMLASGRLSARTVLVSSPNASRSRSAFALDLANIYARAGNVVLIVDADLETPNLTKIVESAIKQAPAATEAAEVHALARRANANYGVQGRLLELWAHLRPTPIANVLLLPGRPKDSSGMPALVPSARWPEFVEALREGADVIIFDGPSLLTGADAALLGPLVDGVVLALDPERDTRSMALEAKGRLQQQGSKLLGAVITPNKRRNPGKAAQPALPAPEPARRSSVEPTTLEAESVVILPETPPAHTREAPSEARPRVIITPMPDRADPVEPRAAEKPAPHRSLGSARLTPVAQTRRRRPPPPATPSDRQAPESMPPADHNQEL